MKITLTLKITRMTYQNNFEPADDLFTQKAEELQKQQKKDDAKTIHELNNKIQPLTNENDTLKIHNYTL